MKWTTFFTTTTLKPTDTIGDVYENIDRYHLNERLGKVLAITQKGSEQPSLSLSWWDECLDKNSHTIDQIEDYIRTYITLHDIDDEESPLWTTLTYIENNNDRMRYVDARAAGLLVGSGNTEAGCKSIVACRAKRSGQRWHPPGVSAALTLRSIHQSDRLPSFWSHLSNRYTARVAPLSHATACS